MLEQTICVQYISYEYNIAVIYFNAQEREIVLDTHDSKNEQTTVVTIFSYMLLTYYV